MSGFVAELLPISTEGPLVRVELAADRRPDDLAFAAESRLVDDLGARLRADPRVAQGGLRVDAGCTYARCTVALDGLATSMPAGLAALDAAMASPLPPLDAAARRVVRREWRHAWRAPTRVFDAALRLAAGETTRAPYAIKPRFSLFVHPPRPVDDPLQWTSLVATGAVDAFGESWTTLVEHTRARLHVSPDVSPAPPLAAVPATPRLLLVDNPGETRATIGLVWASGPDDAVRDVLLAGDFQSVLVQRLRERETYAYDVSAEHGSAWAGRSGGWAGASFQVPLESAGPALAAAKEELARLPTLPAATVAGATRRLQASYGELADTLAGRLALRQLPPPPPAPPPTLAPVGLLAIVVMAPEEALSGLESFGAAEHTDACTVIYGGRCPE